jgi:integrase
LSEIDFKAKTWTIPASRMKAGMQHKVPLSDRALAILNTHIHSGTNIHSGTHIHIFNLSNMAMLELIKRMRPGLTVHGFRSCFMDWAHECTNQPKEVIDMALAHKVGDKVEAAYRRGDLFIKRIKLMAAWAEYCEKPVLAVIPFAQRLDLSAGRT